MSVRGREHFRPKEIDCDAGIFWDGEGDEHVVQRGI